MRTLEPGVVDTLKPEPVGSLDDDAWLFQNGYQHLQSHRLKKLELTPQEQRELDALHQDLKTDMFIKGGKDDGGGYELVRGKYYCKIDQRDKPVSYSKRVAGKLVTTGIDLTTERTLRRRERFLEAKRIKAAYYQRERLNVLSTERQCLKSLNLWLQSKPIKIPRWANEVTQAAGTYGGAVVSAQDWMQRHKRTTH